MTFETPASGIDEVCVTVGAEWVTLRPHLLWAPSRFLQSAPGGVYLGAGGIGLGWERSPRESHDV